MRSSIHLFCFSSLFLILAIAGCSGSSAPKTQSSDLRQVLPKQNILNDLVLRDTAKIYDRSTVWDHLSQQAEIFLNNGLDTLATGIYASSDNSRSLKIEVIEFMEPINAFTMFAMNRNSTTKTISDLPRSYITGDMLCFLKGSHLGRFERIGDIGDDQLIETASMVYQAIVDSTDSWPRHLVLFPPEGRIPNTETLRPLDQMDHEEFPEFFGCQYVVADDTMRLYFMVNSAIGLTTATDEFIGDRGTVDEWLMEGEIQSLVGSHPDHGAVLCAIDRQTLAVVTGYSDIGKAKALAARFFQRLPKQ